MQQAVWVLWNGKHPEDTDIWGIYVSEAAAQAAIEVECDPARQFPMDRALFRIEQYELLGS